MNIHVHVLYMYVPISETKIQYDEQYTKSIDFTSLHPSTKPTYTPFPTLASIPQALLQLHPQRLMNPHTLPYAQIQHDLLTAARNGICPNIAIQPLDFRALATTRVREATEDLARFSGAEFEGGGRLGFGAGDGAPELEHRFGFVHFLALVD